MSIIEARLIKTRETALQAKKRILILGSTVTGLYELREALLEHLRAVGITDTEVTAIRNSERIEEFLLGDVTLATRREHWGVAMGVILLPEMRKYERAGGLSLKTYEDGVDKCVEKLCAQYGVPLIEMRSPFPREGKIEDIEKLLPSPAE